MWQGITEEEEEEEKEETVVVVVLVVAAVEVAGLAGAASWRGVGRGWKVGQAEMS